MSTLKNTKVLTKGHKSALNAPRKKVSVVSNRTPDRKNRSRFKRNVNLVEDKWSGVALYTCKYRIYPNKEQTRRIDMTCEARRFVYNYYLERASSMPGDVYVCLRHLKHLKDELPWLREADSSALRNTLFDLFRARAKCLASKGIGPPRFKSRHDNKRSYTTHGTVRVFDNAVQLPKLGLVKCRVSKEVKGRIINATVSKEPSGKYFVAVCCEVKACRRFPSTKLKVGVDVGIETLVVLSDGTEFSYPKNIKATKDKLREARLRKSNAPEGSSKRKRASAEVNRLREKFKNQRKDFLHRLTTYLVRQYDVICVEDLDINGMHQNKCLAGQINNALWGEFFRMLKYKAEWYGKTVVVIDRYFPSSQICSNCGTKNSSVKNLKVRKWKCHKCNAVHDRDHNAAKNILNEGLAKLKKQQPK